MFLGEAKIPEGMRIYAIGDIHGCLVELTALFSMIETDIAARPVENYRIITLGDLVDRGPQSRGVIDFLIEARNCHPMTFILGNHDQRFMEFCDVPDEVGEGFLHYGGRQALESYDIDPDAGSLREVANSLRRMLGSTHRSFLDSLELMYQCGDFVFVHAGIKPQTAMADQRPEHLLWIRDEFLNHQGSFGHVVVHGHTPDERFDVQPNRINVDTGAYYSGILSCAVLEGTQFRKLQTEARP